MLIILTHILKSKLSLFIFVFTIAYRCRAVAGQLLGTPFESLEMVVKSMLCFINVSCIFCHTPQECICRDLLRSKTFFNELFVSTFSKYVMHSAAQKLAVFQHAFPKTEVQSSKRTATAQQPQAIAKTLKIEKASNCLSPRFYSRTE